MQGRGTPESVQLSQLMTQASFELETDRILLCLFVNMCVCVCVPYLKVGFSFKNIL